MQSLFSSYMTASVWGGVLALVIFTINIFCKKKISVSWQYYIWGIVLLRFLIPVSFQVVVPNFIQPWQTPVALESTLMEQPQITDTENFSPPDGGFVDVNTEANIANTNFSPDVFAHSPIVNGPNNLITMQSTLIALWCVFALLFVLRILFTYQIHLRKIKRNSISADKNTLAALEVLRQKMGLTKPVAVYTVPNIDSPFTTGILRPMILLPGKMYTDSQLKIILQHELIHVARHDVLIKLLAEIARAVHWFNPLAHFTARQISCQCEISCDEAVLTESSDEERAQYSMAILETAVQMNKRKLPLSLAMNHDVRTLKSRVKQILDGRYAKRNMPLTFLFTCIVVSLCVFSVVKASGFVSENNTPAFTFSVEPLKNKGVTLRQDKVNVLIAGVDYDEVFADVIMLASLDTKNGRLTLLSVPRDTAFAPSAEFLSQNENLPSGELMKLCEITAYTTGNDSMAHLKNEIETLLQVPVDYTIQVNMKAFPKIIDALGGIEMDVPQDMYYVDPAQYLEININEGMQLLDGETALHLVRFRSYPDGDFGRIGMQQQFLQKVFAKIISEESLLEMAPLYLQVLLSETKTNITLAEAGIYLPYAGRLSADSFETLQLPGDVGSQNQRSYFFVDIDMFNETIKPVYQR